MTRSEAEGHTILRVQTGSKVLGLNLPGQDDDDQIAIVIEPLSEMLTLGGEFEQLIHRDAAVREGKHDAPSAPGDLDLTFFSLKKFCRLAASGNPQLLMPLFTPKQFTLIGDSRGLNLQGMAEAFISKEAGARFLGYMQGQKARLQGLQGQKRVKRPALEEAHGFDTKYAYHVLRLAYQGLELMTSGKLTLPMPLHQREVLMSVRKGYHSLDFVLLSAHHLEEALKVAIERSSLPDHPDRPRIASWMRNLYLQRWKSDDQVEGFERMNAIRTGFGAPPLSPIDLLDV